MDKLYIHNLVRSINDKKNKKEIVSLLCQYIEKKQLNNYITLDDYIAIKESLPKDSNKMPHILSNLVATKLPIHVPIHSNLDYIKNIITAIHFVNKPPIGLYVGLNSCYHNAAMQILLKIPEFIKFNVYNYEFLFDYFNRIYIRNESNKGLISIYKYGYIELLNFIIQCILFSAYNIKFNNNNQHQGACKIIYMKDNKKYKPEFGHQHSSEEFLVDIISEYSNISNISELFNNVINKEITNIYYNIKYTIINEQKWNSIYLKNGKETLNMALIYIINEQPIFIDVDNIKNTININIEGIINIILNYESHKIIHKIENKPYIQLNYYPSPITIDKLLNLYYNDEASIKASIEKNKLDIYTTCTLILDKIKKTVCKNYLLFNQGQQKIDITIHKEINYLGNTYVLVGYIVGGNLGGGHYIAHILVDNDIYECNDSIITKKEFNTVVAQPSVLLYKNITLNNNINLKPDKEIHNLEQFLMPFSEKINEYIDSQFSTKI